MKIPEDVLKVFEEQINSLEYGTASLTVHIRQGQPRYVIGKEISLMEDNKIEKSNIKKGI